MLSPTTILHVPLYSSTSPTFLYLIILIIFDEEPVILYAIFSNLWLFYSFHVVVFPSALSSQLTLCLFLCLMWVIKFHAHREQHETPSGWMLLQSMLHRAHKSRVPKTFVKNETSIFQTVSRVADLHIMLIIKTLFIGFINGVLLLETVYYQISGWLQ
jgi:hypothetical protein